MAGRREMRFLYSTKITTKSCHLWGYGAVTRSRIRARLPRAAFAPLGGFCAGVDQTPIRQDLTGLLDDYASGD
jgi:hypothetical protein